MPNWKSLEAKDRLLAALVAAHPDKRLLDYRRIATYYGENTTYDSIEGQFRLVRKQAEKLKAAVESGEQEPAPARGSGGVKAERTTSTKPGAAATAARGRKGNGASGAVLSGRVTKSVMGPEKKKKLLQQQQQGKGVEKFGGAAGDGGEAIEAATGSVDASREVDDEAISISSSVVDSGLDMGFADRYKVFDEDAYGEEDWLEC